jgi:formate hydrogenlyase subunit 3/multisubunit Na+/H+ antiporter MnhD subunit
VTLFLAALAVLLAGGALAAAVSRWPRAASSVGAGAAVTGCAAGAVFAVRGLSGEVARVAFAWHVPAGGIVLSCDTLSAFFLLPVFVLGALGAVYGRDYLGAYQGRKSLGVPWLAYDLLIASMAVVVTARHAVLFLFAWEAMTLSSYVLVVFEHEQSESRRAGWVYLIAAHVGTALLLAMFLILGSSAGTFVLGEGGAPPSGARGIVLLLALAGFGVKAGLVPLHGWLPEAHAAAPAHVSALMSGALTKMGVYGLLRVTALVGPTPAWWGSVLVVVGLSGGLFGITVAGYQRDVKRALAYSTIENVGLVVLGLGLGLWGQAAGYPTLAALGLWGGLLHAWNHTAMKGLLFLGAGTIAHATGTRDLEKLGGLLRRAPVGSALFVLGALAIAGLPPLNGFVGEWLLYRSLLDGATARTEAAIPFMLAVGVVSLVGALAALCFLRLTGTALAGQPRSEGAAHTHEMSAGMLAPMGALAVCCVLVGAWPGVLAGPVSTVARAIVPLGRDASGTVQASLVPLGRAALALWALCLITALALFRIARSRTQSEDATWGCGYAAPTARMQYTGSSFAQLVGEIVPRPLGPRVEVVRPSGLFPDRSALASRPDDPVTRSIYEPAFDVAADRFARLRFLQQGALHLYIVYILVAVVAGLVWASLGGGGGE